MSRSIKSGMVESLTRPMDTLKVQTIESVHSDVKDEAIITSANENELFMKSDGLHRRVLSSVVDGEYDVNTFRQQELTVMKAGESRASPV
jgi:hypothetical protein